jgi:hypothetical protein
VRRTRALAAEIADPALQQEQLEARQPQDSRGEPLWANYPPDEQTIAEYKASIAETDVGRCDGSS